MGQSKKNEGFVLGFMGDLALMLVGLRPPLFLFPLIPPSLHSSFFSRLVLSLFISVLCLFFLGGGIVSRFCRFRGLMLPLQEKQLL